MPTEANRLVPSIRLRDEEIDVLLDALDEAGSQDSRRAGKRYPYRIRGLIVYVQHPGAQQAVGYRVPTRNIGAQGLSFLHGGFLHGGTRCRVQLMTTYGTWTNVDSRVIHCRHLSGHVHEVGVAFDRFVDPSQYARCAHRMHILLAEDGDLVAKLAQHYFEQMNAQVTHVGNGREALDNIPQEEFDIVLMDVYMPEMDGITAIEQLRATGYTGLIVAMSADTEEKTRTRCLAAGANDFLPKPFDKEGLSRLLDLVREEPLVSTFYDDDSMRPLIDAYLAELPRLVRKLEEALASESRETLHELTRGIKGEGTSYGFEPLTAQARIIESRMESQPDLASVRADVIKLIKLCHLAFASTQSAESG
jgi:CheY-like chemotaxis protein